MDRLLERKRVRDGITSCQRCELSAQCRSPVPFEGASGARFVVVGEAPGSLEDRWTRPFIGPAGQLVRGTLRDLGVDVSTVAFVNTVSCYPHGTPTPVHVARCQHHLDAQLAHIGSDFILTVGGLATSALWGRDIQITQMAGKWWKQEGRWVYGVLHPAAVLRDRGLEAEWRVQIELFLNGVETGPWVSYHCLKCGTYTEHRALAGGVRSPTGIPYCVKCLGQEMRRGKARRTKVNKTRQGTLDVTSS